VEYGSSRGRRVGSVVLVVTPAVDPEPVQSLDGLFVEIGGGHTPPDCTQSVTFHVTPYGTDHLGPVPTCALDPGYSTVDHSSVPNSIGVSRT
jgi:hypothetical protein